MIMGAVMVYTSLALVYLILESLNKFIGNLLKTQEIIITETNGKREEEEFVALITAAVYGYIRKRGRSYQARQIVGGNS
jgi:hypothetical protein